MKYKDLLEEYYIAQMDSEGIHDGKMAFIGEYVFEFTTYDSEMDEFFARQMLEVIENILNKTTGDYIQDEAAYKTYLLMVNMPFMKDKLEWGTSIRFPWFSNNQVSTIGCGFDVPEFEAEDFLKQLIVWSRETNSFVHP